MVVCNKRRPNSFTVDNSRTGGSEKLRLPVTTGEPQPQPQPHWIRMERSSHHSSELSFVPTGTPTTDRTLPRPVPESATKASERSAVVLALFGPSVGPCVGDFSTTYNRVNGRLYAATRAILFYSNLFGFERRLCLQFADIESIEAYRSTSIRIAMVDCEDHIFRKFFNRDNVLRLLKELFQAAVNNNNNTVLSIDNPDRTPIRRINQTEEDMDSLEEPLRVRLPSEHSQSEALSEPLESTLRPRSQSVPSLNKLITVQERAKLDLSLRPRTFLRSLSKASGGKVTPTNENGRRRAESNEDEDGGIDGDVDVDADVNADVDGASAFSVVVGPNAPSDFDMKKAWAEAKVPYNDLALSVSCVVLS